MADWAVIIIVVVAMLAMAFAAFLAFRLGQASLQNTRTNKPEAIFDQGINRPDAEYCPAPFAEELGIDFGAEKGTAVWESEDGLRRIIKGGNETFSSDARTTEDQPWQEVRVLCNAAEVIGYVAALTKAKKNQL